MTKEAWRASILELLAEDEDVDVDVLHVESDGDDDLALAEEVVADLSREGLAWEDDGVVRPRAGRLEEIWAALDACRS